MVAKECTAHFLRYESSEWEKEWVENIWKWQDVVCETMLLPEHSSRARESAEASKYFLKNGSAIFDPNAVSSEVFSRFFHKYSCDYGNGTVKEEVVSSWIEPLVGASTFEPCSLPRRQNFLNKGLTRHPLTCEPEKISDPCDGVFFHF